MTVLNSFRDLQFMIPVIEKLPKEKIKESLFKINYFNNIIYQDNNSNFETVFTDDQVINLIYKISNRNLRKLVWEFERIKVSQSDRFLHLKFILHKICMKLLNKFGAKMLSFILNLNVHSRTEEVSDYHPNPYNINIDKENLNFDTISIQKGYHKIHLGFEISDFNKKPYMIVCNSNGYLSGRINEFGYLEDGFINRISFNLFEFLEDGHLSYFGAILNCHCRICNRELTVPESVYYGIGPTCRGGLYY